MARSSTPIAPGAGLRFVVIGAGMAGILAAIKLGQAGYDDVVIYEKADRLGGTWRENTYPGVTCDVPSHLYSYSFEPNPEWSRRFSPGAEIQTYFEDVARRHQVVSRIRYGTEITRCEFRDGRWRIHAGDVGVCAFANAGWGWGGDFDGAKDYHHEHAEYQDSNSPR